MAEKLNAEPKKAEPLHPRSGDLCWNAYWRMFYVELAPLSDGSRVNWWLGAVGGESYSNASRDDHVTVHQTLFRPGEDKVIMPWIMICDTFRYTIEHSYAATRDMYRTLALDAVRHGVHQRWTTIDEYAWPRLSVPTEPSPPSSPTTSTTVPASTTEKRTALVVGKPHPF